MKQQISPENNHVLDMAYYVALGIIAIVPIIFSIFGGMLDCDSAYYLLIAEQISSGSILYVDIACGYTPLWFYLMAGLKLLFHLPDGCYEVYLLIHYLFTLSCAFLIYVISCQSGAKSRIAYFVAWLFVMLSHWMQGNIVLLEMPSIFFGLFSLQLTIKYKNSNCWTFVWIGLLSSCAFLCKQFGLGFVFLSAVVLFCFGNSKWRQVLCLLVGFLIPVVLMWTIWKDYFIKIVFSGYGTTSAAEAGYETSIGYRLLCVADNYGYLFSRIAPALLMSIFFVRELIKEEKICLMALYWLGIFGFMLQFYFVFGGVHYWLYVLPFVSLVIGLSLSIKTNALWKRYALMLTISVSVIYSAYADYHNRLWKIYLHPEIKSRNIAVSDAVKQYVPQDKSLWIVHGGLFPVYYYTQLVPPNLNTIGYSFGPLGLSEQRAFMQATSADYVLSFVEDYPYESFYTDSLKAFVERHEQVAISEHVILFDMSKTK